MTITCYADGGCSPNPGPGGWGVFIETPEATVCLSGGERESTNNRMELTAAIKALEYFPEGTVMEMRCDSRYVIDSITQWIRGWKAKGWRTTTGPVKNVELMQRLDALASKRRVKWTWVRGHNGNAGNEKADSLVHKGRREAALGKLEAEPLVTPRAGGSAPAASVPTATPSSPMAAAPAVPAGPRTAQVPLDMALGLEVSRAAKAAGLTPQAFVERAVRLSLALGPKEVERLSAGKRPDAA